MRQDTGGSKERVPERFEENEQTKENLHLMDEAINAIHGVNIKKGNGCGSLKFLLVVILAMFVLVGVGFYLGSRSQQSAEIDQTQVDKLAEERGVAELTKSEELIAYDVALGMPKIVARFKHWKLARARRKVLEAYIPFKVLKDNCAGLLAANDFSEANINDSVTYRQCREKVVAQLQSFEIEAKTKAMNETAYQQTRTSYDEKITLLEAARQKCSEWQEAEQKLADLQNTKQEKWCSVVNRSAAALSLLLILFIAVLFPTIRYWLEAKQEGMAGLLLLLLLIPVILAGLPISDLINF